MIYRINMNGMPQDPRQIAQIANMLTEQIRAKREQLDANPNDSMALASIGEAQLELAMLKQGDEATKILEESTSNLRQSLKIYPANAHALVVLASALNARAFLQYDANVARSLFDEATKNFERALELDPENQRCRELLQAMENAPALHAQVVDQLKMQEMMGGMGMGGYPGAMGGKAVGDDEWIYDALGWTILVTGAIGFLIYSNLREN